MNGAKSLNLLSRRAVIAGAGIAGLSAAIALSQAGFKVVIYDKANTLEEFGAGLQLTPNATRILSRLGVLKWVLPSTSRPHAVLVLRGSNNSKLMRMPLDETARRWGSSYLTVHRADLQRALIAAAQDQSGIELALGTTVLDFTDDGRRLLVGVAKGLTQRREEADLLIGADGLRSQVRERLGFGARDEADFAGRVAYRAILDSDDAYAEWTQNVILRLGEDAHLVQYPLRGGSMINVVATVRAAPPTTCADLRKNQTANRLSLERAFAGWSKEARLLTNAPAQWRAWPLYHRPPISSFSLGRVALVGDAAHPMVPFLAQGAAQAIEDAGELVRVLVQGRDIPDALSIYSRGRVARAGRVQQVSLKLGHIYHMSGPSAFARDVTMRLLGGRRLIERYDWLYGG